MGERDREALQAVLRWAEQRCPCREETPNPCPLCGASVENLEACKSAENTMPRDLLAKVRHALSEVNPARAQAGEPVAAPAGFVLVPEKLTPEIKAVMKRCEAGELSMAEAWSAMLAASPVPALDGKEMANPDWLPFAAQWGGYALLLQARRLCAEIEKLPGGLDQSAMIDRASEVAFALQQFQMRGEYHWRPIPAPAQEPVAVPAGEG